SSPRSSRCRVRFISDSARTTDATCVWCFLAAGQLSAETSLSMRRSRLRKRTRWGGEGAETNDYTVREQDMGYDLHITRKKFWGDPKGPAISLDEWLAYLAGDPDIVQDWENPGPENSIFIAHPEKWPIWWRESGEIYTKNPDSVMIAKLVQIANRLG